jgi:hypothetical protein
MYKVWLQADSSGKWATNGLEFGDAQEAEDWGFELACRWTAVRDWVVWPVGQNPNDRAIPTGVQTG